ncbi:MAG: adenylosuccinate lyase, partial [Salibacteraceae bacterium]
MKSLEAISPIDGRYASKTAPLSQYFSEYALFKYRVWVEVEYFIALCELPLPQLQGVEKSVFLELRKMYTEFTVEEAQQIKDIEKVTNHDVKAVEYFIKDKMKGLGLESHSEFVHFGLTSQDINNTANPMMIRDALDNVIAPKIRDIVDQLEYFSREWKNIPMLARTHGQPASPTRLGKEIQVFSERIKEQLEYLYAVPVAAKFGGATG